MSWDVIHGDAAPSSALPFSPAVRAGDFVFVSGQASVNESGQIVEDDFEGEMRRSFDNVTRVLASAGLTLRDVVQVRAYVGRQEDLASYNQVYRELMTEPFPARTTIMGCLGTLLKFEVDVVAWVGGVEER